MAACVVLCEHHSHPAKRNNPTVLLGRPENPSPEPGTRVLLQRSATVLVSLPRRWVPGTQTAYKGVRYPIPYLGDPRSLILACVRRTRNGPAQPPPVRARDHLASLSGARWMRGCAVVQRAGCSTERAGRQASTHLWVGMPARLVSCTVPAQPLDTLDGAHPYMREPVVAVFCSRGMSSSSRCARLRTRPDCSIAA